MKNTGRYIRKRGKTGVYHSSDGWHRKWTHKVAWYQSGKKIHLVAMTDGMITAELTPEEFDSWMTDKDMVFMSRKEMIEFIENGSDNFAL